MSCDVLTALPQCLLVCHVGPAATSQELGRFCLTSTGAGKLEPLLVRQVAETQHGIFEVIVDDETGQRKVTLAEVHHTLDAVRDRASFEFTRAFMAAVLKPEQREGDNRREPEFMLVDVGGGRTGFRTVAACPPVQGDYWRLLVPLRRGRYQLIVSGWRNPHHGILDITLDEEAISPSEGLDWYAEASTSAYTYPPMMFEVKSTGTHILRGETSRCHKSAIGAKYWICLESIRILPADEALVELPQNDLPSDLAVVRDAVALRTMHLFLRNAVARRSRRLFLRDAEERRMEFLSSSALPDEGLRAEPLDEAMAAAAVHGEVTSAVDEAMGAALLEGTVLVPSAPLSATEGEIGATDSQIAVDRAKEEDDEEDEDHAPPRLEEPPSDFEPEEDSDNTPPSELASGESVQRLDDPSAEYEEFSQDKDEYIRRESRQWE